MVLSRTSPPETLSAETPPAKSNSVDPGQAKEDTQAKADTVVDLVDMVDKGDTVVDLAKDNRRSEMGIIITKITETIIRTTTRIRIRTTMPITTSTTTSTTIRTRTPMRIKMPTETVLADLRLKIQ